MAKKESGKKVTLPAIGKPKPKPKKTSARDLGKVANKQFKQGARDANKKVVDSPFASVGKETAKQSAQRERDARKAGVSDKSLEEVDSRFFSNPKKMIESRKRKMARITGV